MLRFFVSRILHLLSVLLVVSLLTMLLMDLVPGDPVYRIAGTSATPEQLTYVRQQLNLDAPLLERYWDWISGVVTGDLGVSFRTRQPVLTAVTERLSVTLEVALLALVIALAVAIPMGVFTAYRSGGRLDRFWSATSSMLISAPPFVSALLLVFLFAVTLRIFPVFGWVPLTKDVGENLHRAFLPALVLALAEIPLFSRLLRSDVMATLQQDFVLNAQAKGLSTPFILFRHVLRPSSLALFTLAGLSLGRLIGGTIIVETIFSLPGLGSLLVNSIMNNDLVMLQGAVLMIAIAYVLVNGIVDVAQVVLDPRVGARSAR